MSMKVKQRFYSSKRSECLIMMMMEPEGEDEADLGNQA